MSECEREKGRKRFQTRLTVTDLWVQIAPATPLTLARHHSKPRGEDLHEDANQSREEDDEEELVPVVRSRLEIGSVVARVDVCR